MLESFKDLKLSESKNETEMEIILKEKLGIGFSECAKALSDSLIERAEKLLEDLPNIAPYNDYYKMIEDKVLMLKFLQEDAAKLENWIIQFIEIKKEKDQLMELVFFNKAVDSGDVVKGFVFLGLSGKIRHAFVQVNV